MNKFTEAEIASLIASLRDGLQMPDLRDDELIACVMRLNLEGWCVVRSEHLTAELANSLRMAAQTLATEMRRIADDFDERADAELLGGGAVRVRDDLLYRWIAEATP